MLLQCIVLYCIVLYCIVLYCIVLYCIVLYCIVLYCIVSYCIVLYWIHFTHTIYIFTLSYLSPTLDKQNTLFNSIISISILSLIFFRGVQKTIRHMWIGTHSQSHSILFRTLCSAKFSETRKLPNVVTSWWTWSDARTG